jgi:hypothetical protein
VDRAGIEPATPGFSVVKGPKTREKREKVLHFLREFDGNQTDSKRISERLCNKLATS